MNDADLEKLAIKPGKLEPTFNRNVTNYAVSLPSTVTKIDINPLTSDADASWTVVGHGCKRTIPISPGQQKTIIIEITAEDGSTKQYSINITSLSPSEVTLSGIKLSVGNLNPDFKNSLFDYTVEIPWFTKDVKILPESKDKDVDGCNRTITIDLNYGTTLAQFSVTSPDKSCIKTYKLKLVKDKILRVINSVDQEQGSKVYCPLCLGILHCPVSLKSDAQPRAKTLYCKKCVENLIRTRKIDPFEDVPLKPDCIEEETECITELSDVLVKCCYSQNGCTEEVKIEELGHHMKNCMSEPIFAQKFEGVIFKKQLEGENKVDIEACKLCSHAVRKDELNVHLKQYCPAQQPNTRINHIVQLRDWEKKLHEKAFGDIEDTKDVLKPRGENVAFEDLEAAAVRYAAMIKMKPREFSNHFKLALVLEEMFYAKDIWGNKSEVKSGEDEDDKTLENLMDMASDSSKEDDIVALCEARGVGKNSPLSLKLKAIDEEYHSLLDQNQSAKADYVQKLYVWKSKQSVGGRSPVSAVCEDSFLGKAFLKYKDACACSPNNWMLHLHVGRHLLMQRRYEDAIQRLEAAFGLKPTSIEARFYIGLAYAKQIGPRQKLHETITYLQDGLDYILLKLFEEPEVDLPRCSAEIFVRNSNVLILEGMLELGNLLRENGCKSEKDKIRIIGTYRQTSIVCFHYLNNMQHRNETYHQLLWVLLRTHFELGLFIATELKKQSSITTKQKIEMQCYWERLAALTKAIQLPMDNKIMNIQIKICEEAVSLCPSSSQALFRLGDIQLMTYDQEPNNNENILKDAESSFRASIELEGKPVHDSQVSSFIMKSDWWKRKHTAGNHHKPSIKSAAAVKTKSENAAVKKQTKNASTPKGAVGTAKPMPGKSTAVPKTTAPAQKKTALSPKNATATYKTGATASKGSAASKSTSGPSKTSAKGAATTLKTSKSNQKVPPRKTDSPQAKTSDQKLGNSSHHACSSYAPPKAQENKEAPPERPREQSESSNSEVPEIPILNKVSYQARLGLARVLSRDLNNSDQNEVKELYENVMEIAPYNHDAYIELGSMLTKDDPQRAIEVYSKFPFSQELSFDDAYLHGEIVRILMNCKNYDDPNLERSMIAYGTVMGLSVLDKHVSELESKFKFKILRNVYAGVNKKDIEDEDLQQFFKFKCWV